ncbi:MAG: sugar phosphate isomerase/epimerase [Thiotrichales bacterium]|nr:sugar phosphate isomerase/epimerase [Thiotrichales bacterium]MBT6770970.1 sugar phosphate isomerase/epimerase [Thiotrichales bacterium]MBT7149693.1 sugar phosphate isomerase/epimerase [Thiotrichales bacterium]MBT7439165.1 sugar phosphate isomerase/epimerase [Thiotrichales bacterium]MBT7933607.1 sugar phosphate isomerase/epimerase [Thiotrichales bacterium]
MIKGISYLSFENGLSNNESIESALIQTQSNGFEALELSVSNEGVINTNLSDSECSAIRQKINDSGVFVDSIATGMSWGISPTSDDAGVRKNSIKLHQDAIKVASHLDCKALLFVPGVVKSPISPEIVRYDRALDRLREAINQMLPIAEDLDVDLCMENVWNGFFYSPIELRDFVDSFESNKLGVYLDIGNLIGYQQYPPHWVELLNSRIKRIQIKDFQENFDWTGSFSFCDIGTGDVPWKETISALKSIQYKSTIIAEMLPWDETILSRTSAAMDQIFDFK